MRMSQELYTFQNKKGEGLDHRSVDACNKEGDERYKLMI